jgi:UPF0176 protein
MADEILSFYRFQPQQDPERCARLFFDPAQRHGLLGTVLIAPEGWNVSLAGEKEAVDSYLQELALEPDYCPEALEVKRMRLGGEPFRRLIYKVKPEIIRFGRKVDISEGQGTYISADQLHSMLRDHKDEIMLLDVRNAYEAAAGTFEGALTLPIEQFSDLPDALSNNELPEDRTIITFCTGGIRCEKAVAYMRTIGKNNVLQVEGGIWRYLEKYPYGFFKGKCFWFDEREEIVSIN